jgi:RNA polymerase sigma-70 factor (ECF subfamily)
VDLPDSIDVWTEVRQRISREAILRVLSHLSPEQRAVIELAFFSGYTHVEIAERMGLPLGAVKGRVRLGLQRLRELLVATDAEPLSAAVISQARALSRRTAMVRP